MFNYVTYSIKERSIIIKLIFKNDVFVLILSNENDSITLLSNVEICCILSMLSKRCNWTVMIVGTNKWKKQIGVKNKETKTIK